ncbi:uncharacterized protein LOC115672894 [Syzygium oleosum]|uniref:uncharacterized protein LOC115672894 n=1 Tax=Syzygium oleosum TaxID=219896 RepID=UPI0024BA909A|nr:uncharacterized protein LOC115672894 [Syzygium oleosum]
MAGPGVVAEDEESVLSGSKVLPMSSPIEERRNVKDTGRHKPTSLTAILGLKDFFSLEVWRASLAELVGMAVLVFSLDTIVISSYETKTETRNLVMSFLIAITLAILLLVTSPVSGGHINPVVTFSAALTGLISLSRAAIYILAQCGGAVLGALALKAVVSSKIDQTFSLGGCTLNIIAPGPKGPVTIGLELVQALSLEIICTFVFLFVSVWIAFDHRQSKALGRVVIFNIIGAVVGLLVFISTTVTATKGYAGVGMNPARCLGPALVRGGHLWNGHWVFWVRLTIACVGFYLYVKIIPTKHFHHAEGYKYDVLNILKAPFA